jgi:hypothetical protein
MRLKIPQTRNQFGVGTRNEIVQRGLRRRRDLQRELSHHFDPP